MTLNENLIQLCGTDLRKEVCGLILSDDSLLKITNVSSNPHHFIFDREEYFTSLRKIKANGLAVKAVFHSHLTGCSKPSQDDIETQQRLKLDMVIVSGGKINWIPYATTDRR